MIETRGHQYADSRRLNGRVCRSQTGAMSTRAWALCVHARKSEAAIEQSKKKFKETRTEER